METQNLMTMLAESYWGRPAIDAERVAMAGEAARDAARIAPLPAGGADALFTVEPAHFEAILRAQVRR